MLYLEDYLEMIEHLPQELRDRFTEIREMDLQVHNAMDNLETEVKVFFSNAKRSKPEIRELEFQKIKNEYLKTLEDAEEKVSLATQMFELVDKYLRRLDQELDKFKTELEADNAGITEILERRSHELDVHPNHSSSHHLSSHHSNNNAVRKRFSLNQTSLTVREGMSGLSFGHHNPSLASAAAGAPNGNQSNPMFSSAASSTSTPLTLYNANNALAAAASQAIQATQQMQSGRRTGSFKASIDALNTLGGLSASFSGFNEPFPGPLSSFSSLDASASGANRGTKRNRSSSHFHDSDPSDTLRSFETNGDSLSTWNLDPDEPTYCICNQVSYGEMVACDNDDCEIEWFHYACVALSAAPKGKWYCPPCLAKMKKKRV